MKRIVTIACILIFAVGVARAQVLNAVLTSGSRLQERDMGGLATIVFDPASNTVDITLALVNSAASVSRVHIHKRNVEGNDVVVLDVPVTAKNLVNSRLSAQNVVPATLGADLITNSSAYYLDVHSDASESDSVRGDLVLQMRRRAVNRPPIVSSVPGCGTLAAGVLLKLTGEIDDVCTSTERVNGDLARLAITNSRLTVPTFCHPTIIPFFCSNSVCTCIADNFGDAIDLATAGLCKYDSWNCDDSFRCSCRLAGCVGPIGTER